MKNHHLRRNNPEVIRCHTKRAFASKAAAEFTGQRSYRCPVCQYWHRTGPVRKISNPVLRTSTTCLIIALILRLVFDAVQARGDVVVDKSPAEVRYAIVEYMMRRGYQVDAVNTSTIYISHPSPTFNGLEQVCTSQKFKFVLWEEGDKTAVQGFAVCYGKDITFTPGEMDALIAGIIKNIPLRFP